MPEFLKPKGNPLTDWLPAPIKALTDLVFPEDDLGIDPTSGVLDSVASPLISIFKDRAARELGTQAAVKKAQAVSPEIGAAFERLAQKYPRVTAHIDPSKANSLKAKSPTVEATTMPTWGTVRSPIPMNFFEPGLQKAAQGPLEADKLVRHEATHVAQSLGNSDLVPLYGIAEDLAGYVKNPFEITARIAEERVTNPKYQHMIQRVTPELVEARRAVGPGNYIQGLKNLVLETMRAGKQPYTVTRGLEQLAQATPTTPMEERAIWTLQRLLRDRSR